MSDSSIFTTSKDGLANCLVLEEKVGADRQLWIETFGQLPLLTASDVTEKSFSEDVNRNNGPAVVLETLTGFRVAAEPKATAFADFIAERVREIRSAFETARSFHTATVSVIASASPCVEIDLIDLKRESFATCGSREPLDMWFGYRHCRFAFDENVFAGQRTMLDAVIRSTSAEDVTAAPNFLRA